jgi:hypothetical protein
MPVCASGGGAGRSGQVLTGAARGRRFSRSDYSADVNFVLVELNFVLTIVNYVLAELNFVLTIVNYVLAELNFVLTIVSFVLVVGGYRGPLLRQAIACLSNEAISSRDWNPADGGPGSAHAST